MNLWDLLVYKMYKSELTRYVGKKKIIVLPEHIKRICPNAFFESRVTSVDINKVEDLAKYAFHNTKFIEEVILNDNIKEIPQGCFEACFSLNKIEIPNTVTKIGRQAFGRCSELSTLTIPSSVTTIEQAAFEESALKSVCIPETVTSLDVGLFKGCRHLVEAKIDCFMDDIYDDMFCECRSLSSVTLPKGIKRIGNQAFSNCISLKDFEIESSVEIIGENALAGTLLSEIDLSNVTEIGKGCFAGCENLEEVTLGNKLTIIPESAFEGSTLFGITFPKNISAIDANAFSNCEFLETIRFLSSDVNIHYTAFTNCENLKTIYYKGEKLDVSNIELYYIDNSVLEYLYEHRDILDKIKSPMSLNTISNLEKAGVLEEFISNANYKYYKQILKEFRKHRGASEDDIEERLFLFCYTMGIFDNELCQKSGELIKDLTERNRIRPNNITSLTYNLEFKSVDKNMVKEITDLKGVFLKELIEKTGEFPKVVGLSLSRYNEVQQHNTSENAKHRRLRPTAQKFIDFFNVDKFSNVENKADEEIAKEIGKFYSRQYVYDLAKVVMDRFNREGTTASLISEENRKEEMEIVKEEIYDSLHKLDDSLTRIYYEFLLKNDPRNLTAGRYCSDCCGHIEGMGEDIAYGSILDSRTQTLVMKDAKNDIVSKAVFYVNNEGEIIVNGIYFNDELLSGKEEMLAQKYLEAFNIFIEDYNNNHEDKVDKVYLSIKSPLTTEFIYKGEKKGPINVVDYGIYHMDRELVYSGDCGDGVVCIIDKPQNIGVKSRKR